MSISPQLPSCRNSCRFEPRPQESGVEQGEAVRRAEDAVVRIQDSLIVSRALGDTAPFLRAMQQLPRQLLGDRA